MITKERDSFDEFKSMDDVAEDSSEERHVTEEDAKLGSNQSLAMMFFLRSSHADGSSDARQLTVVGHEEGFFGVDRSSSSARVALKVTSDARFTSPALEHLASFVTKTLLTHAKGSKVLGHLWGNIGTSFEHYSAFDDPVYLQVEEETRKRRVDYRSW